MIYPEGIVKEKRLFKSIGLICILATTISIVACNSNTNSTPTTTPTATPEAAQVPIPPPPVSIKIGAAISLTGSQASGGLDLKWGYQQAVNDINAAGGIYLSAYKQKFPVVLSLYDDESDATKTVSKLEQLATEGVCAYLGAYSSGLNAAAAPIAEKNLIPMVAVAFANLAPHQQGYKYLFSPFVKTTTGVDAIFQLLNTLGSSKPTKIGVWAEKSDWGVEIAKAVPDYAKKYGYQIVQNKDYDTTATDYSSFITEAKQLGVEVVIGVPTPTAAVAISKQMKELDYNPSACFFWRGAGASTWAKNLGKDGDYTLYLANWDPHYPTQGTPELVESYKKANGGNLPSVNVGSAYAAVQVLADAIARAGFLDKNKIRDALASTKNLHTIEGFIQSFDSTGVGILPPAIMQWQNQTSQVVYPADYASSPLLYPAKKWKER
jgi:branched-chain amino acid transport system substrate-binding protein